MRSLQEIWDNDQDAIGRYFMRITYQRGDIILVERRVQWRSWQ